MTGDEEQRAAAAAQERESERRDPGFDREALLRQGYDPEWLRQVEEWNAWVDRMEPVDPFARTKRMLVMVAIGVLLLVVGAVVPALLQ